MELLELQYMESCCNDYAKYVEYAHRGKWILAPHLQLVCDNVQKLINREIKQNILIISMPPQHGKSQCITESLPSWYIGNNPCNRVIEVSYGDDLAQRFGRRNKEKILEFGKQLFGIELSKVSDTDFEVKEHKGSMISKGIMAGLTGNPADLIIIDDPIKNRQEAESETYRNRIWEEFLNSINTRLSANGVIILIQTRWHEDDLAGRLLQHMPDKCLEINIPLEAEENDILGRSVGDSLFPQIGKDNTWLAEFKQAYKTAEGSRSWDALMQGRPSAQEGSLIKRYWWKYWIPKGSNLPKVSVKNKDGITVLAETIEIPDSFDRMLQTWDLAFKKKEDSDFISGQVMANRGADIFLIDLINERLSFSETLKAIENMAVKHPDAITKLIEDKANGPAIIDMLHHKIGGIIPIEPEGSKQARVEAVTPIMESGNVYIPHPMLFDWVNGFIDQCSKFPNVAHDDMVDAFSQGLYRFIYASNKQEKPKLPADMPDDVRQDLENDPQAMQMYLRERGLV